MKIFLGFQVKEEKKIRIWGTGGPSVRKRKVIG